MCVMDSDRSSLLVHHSDNVVSDHLRVYGIFCEAVTGSAVKEKIVSCWTVVEAWDMLAVWMTPDKPSHILLLEPEFMHVSFNPRYDPKHYVTRSTTSLIMTQSTARCALCALARLPTN